MRQCSNSNSRLFSLVGVVASNIFVFDVDNLFAVFMLRKINKYENITRVIREQSGCR